MRQKIILITGTDSGIGRQTTEHLAAQNYHIIACVLKHENMNLWQEYQNITPIKLDITKDEDLKALENYLVSKKIKDIDMLVNNAGISVWGPILDIPIDIWKDVFNTNIFSMVSITKTLLPYLNHEKAKIINIGSTSNRIGLPLMGCYPLSKLCVARFSEILRRELKLINRYKGISVSVIDPGTIKTPIWIKAKKIQFDKDGPLYEIAKTNGLQLIEQEYQNATNPLKVAQLIAHLIERKQVKRRYLVGKGAWMMHLLGYLPISLQDYLISLWAALALKSKEPK